MLVFLDWWVPLQGQICLPYVMRCSADHRGNMPFVAICQLQYVVLPVWSDQTGKVCPNNDLIQHCFPRADKALVSNLVGQHQKSRHGPQMNQKLCWKVNRDVFTIFLAQVFLQFNRRSYFLVEAHVYSFYGWHCSTHDICPMLMKYFLETCYLV